MPLSTGIDHVIMNLSFSPRSDTTIELIQQLAAQYGLVLWDPQSREAHLPEQDGSAQHDEVADLRARYRAACLDAFVRCEHVPTREWLARGFILDESFYLPDSHALVAQARQIALADPDRFKDLLFKTADGTNMAAIHFQAEDGIEP